MAPKANGAAVGPPKRPMSGFMLFSKTFHEDFKKKNPTAKYDVKEVAKLAGAQWGKMNDVQKKKYNDEYGKAKVKYDKFMETYDGPMPTRKVKEGGRAKKDPNAPKRPMSSYILFANDQRNKVRSELPNASMKEVTSELARRWRELDAKAKSKYDKMAVDAKGKYSKEMEKYNAKKGDSPKKGAAPKPAAGRGRKPAVQEEESEEEDDEDEDDEEEDDE